MLVVRHQDASRRSSTVSSTLAIEMALRRNPCSEGADRVKTPAAPTWGRAAVGADSSTACALLPPRPNELNAHNAPAAANHCGLSATHRPGSPSRNVDSAF